MKPHLLLSVAIALLIGLVLGYLARPSLESTFGFQAAVDSPSSAVDAKTWAGCIAEAARDGIITQAEFDACEKKFGKPKILPDSGMYTCLSIALQNPPPPLPDKQVTSDEYNACYNKYWKLPGAETTSA